MPPYVITGTGTYSSTANRDAAKVRVDAVVATYALISLVTSLFTAGVSLPDTIRLNISVQVPDGVDPKVVHDALYNAMIGAGGTVRHSSGWLGVNKT